MGYDELRYGAIATLLQADEPLTLSELEAACRAVDGSSDTSLLQAVLKDLVDASQVIEGDLLPGQAALQYAWRARWESRARERASDLQQDLRAALEITERVPPEELNVESRPATAFYSYVVSAEYTPPANKRFLVFLQCSVRRPFSTAPSHAPLRRAIRTATGYDPRADFRKAPRRY